MTTGVHAPRSVYPAHLSARFDESPSRWLWLVKWLLLIPHCIVLVFLWIAFFAISVIAFFSILVTGRYPRALFDFNVGVLRWTWRVQFYGYSALGTDRYPPFSLHDDPEYPAKLDVDYPEHLSRGLVLVKWWLLAIPQYLIVAIFTGGAWSIWRTNGDPSFVLGGGLIGLLVLVVGLTLLFSGRYPKSLFDLLLGLDRWVLRVAAYAALMTDVYPPFRLDQGESDGPDDAIPSGPPATAPAAESIDDRSSHWSAMRIVGVVVGSIFVCTSIAAASAGGAAIFADRELRDSHGFLNGPEQTYATTQPVLVSDAVELHGFGALLPQRILGTARIEVTAIDSSQRIFVGIAPASSLDRTLGMPGRGMMDDWNGHPFMGMTPDQAFPSDAVWAKSQVGKGTQTLVWTTKSGTWRAVIANRPNQPGVAVNVQIGATVPALDDIGIALAAFGLFLLIAGLALIAVAAGSASRGRPTSPTPPIAPEQPSAPSRPSDSATL